MAVLRADEGRRSGPPGIRLRGGMSMLRYGITPVTNVTTPADRGTWDELLAADPRALVTQTPAWLDCLCEVPGYTDATRLYELPGGRRLVLPLARRIGAGGLATQASLPDSWGFGGPGVDGAPRAVGG